jgi:methyl-accepting chemotaxis protein
VGLSINSWRTITEVYNQAHDVDKSVSETAAVAQFAARVGETSAKVTQYALSENDGDLRAAQRALDQLQQQIASVTTAYAEAGPDNSAVDKLRGLADQYRNSVTATIEAIKARRANGAGLVLAATELSTTVAAIVEALAHDTNNAGALDDAIRLIEVFHGSNASATRFLASRNPADSDTTRVDVEAMSHALKALQARSIDNRRVLRFLKAMAEPLDRYTKAVNGLIAATGQFARVASDRKSAATALIEAAEQIRLAAAEVQLGTVGGMMITVSSARRLAYVASAFAIVAGLILAFVIGRSIARPIQQITDVMRRLAYDTVDVVIPYASHHNEIGAMAEAVRVFRDNKIEADRLSDVNETEQKNKEQRAKSLETTAAALTSTLSAAAAGLQQSAEVMFARTEEAGQRSGAVRAATQLACASIESVASAVEELSVSIDGISDSATRSSCLSARTSEGARSTDRAVQDLAEDAREIERIISLIKEVAQQTNLLALNATIEAARAGQAGRGFAVVASEVKALAAQTGTATEEIEAQVSRIQTVTANVVTAIQDIVAKIGEMNVIATSVAAAVDQQRGATRTIAQNAQQALSSALEAVRTIASIEDASAATKTEANQVLAAAHQLSRQSDDLHVEFDKFIVGVRSA